MYNRQPPGSGGGIPPRPMPGRPGPGIPPAQGGNHYPPQQQQNRQGGGYQQANYQQGGGQRQQAPSPGMAIQHQLRPAKSPDSTFIFRNLVAVSPQDFPSQARHSEDFYVIINDQFVLTAKPCDQLPPGHIGLSEEHRMWAGVSMTDTVTVRLFDPFSGGGREQSYLAGLEVEISFRSRRTTSEELDQDELAKQMNNTFANQILAPGQRMLMERKGVVFLLQIRNVRLGLLGQDQQPPPEDAETVTVPTARGILIPHSEAVFVKAKGAEINLKESMTRPVQNQILDPDFKFESLGIGGLHNEFGSIFRRAFSTRCLPAAIRKRMGVTFVRGILLYGPPGTGKTLIARKIGEMLRAHEPKIINGPEVLNKYVGQSEENIRKLFADAEAEYKEKGDESQLHVIIFDELDAVCKQRGSGTSGGTGVGDNVVNQLLAKLDGVKQLNNFLLIGMTNRKDMIDDALLRPGRLEVHMKIPLPDEPGREEILSIHTADLRKNDSLAPDVDLKEIARRSKNYSGAELAGVVRAAVSMVASRNTDPDNLAKMSSLDPNDFVVRQSDLLNAVTEVTPAFGVSDDEFKPFMAEGIINFSQNIDRIMDNANTAIQQVRAGGRSSLYTMLLHGPPGAGKSALASKIAVSSGFPFVKLISSNHMVGMHESSKLQHITKVMDDAYNSPLSIVVIDDIEQIFDWIDEGPRFENATRKALSVVLGKRPPEGKNLMIIATTSQRAALDRLGMLPVFLTQIYVPNVQTYEELQVIVENYGNISDARGAVEEVRSATDGKGVNVGIKKILYDIEAAQRRPENQNFVFAQRVALQM